MLAYECQTIKEGKQADLSQEGTRMRVLRGMASSIMNFLDFTYEFCQGEKKPVPVLDSHLWVGYSAREAQPWFIAGQGGLEPQDMGHEEHPPMVVQEARQPQVDHSQQVSHAREC